MGREIILFYSENYMKYIYVFCRQNVQVLNVYRGVNYTDHQPSRGYNGSDRTHFNKPLEWAYRIQMTFVSLIGFQKCDLETDSKYEYTLINLFLQSSI